MNGIKAVSIEMKNGPYVKATVSVELFTKDELRKLLAYTNKGEKLTLGNIKFGYSDDPEMANGKSIYIVQRTRA